MVKDIHVDRVFTTSRFDSNYSKLVRKHKTGVTNKLKEILNKLINLQDVSNFKPHPLNVPKRTVYELHIQGDVLLLYSYEGDMLVSLDLVLEGITNHDRLNIDARKDRNISTVTHIDDNADAETVLSASLEAARELESNSVSADIPEEIDNFLQDIAQMTNIISYNDIIKFGKKLSQSEQYRNYALGGIEHLMDRWGEAALYEDELMMDDIAYDIKSYMTFPIQKTVTKESADAGNSHRESFRLNNVLFSVIFNGDRVSMKSHHPYDDAEYHYAISKDGGEQFSIYRDRKFVEQFAPDSFDEDEESSIRNFNWNEVARELLRLDKSVESRIDHT